MSSSRKRKTSDGIESNCGKKIAMEQSIKTEDDLGDNWREKCKGTRASNAYALKKNILTDVKFIVGSDGVECHAHRLILALGSPVFEAMFFGGLAEKGEFVTIPDVSAEGFRHLLRYLYSEDITFKDDVDAFKTYVAADKYCVTHLKEECELYLCNCPLSPSNVWIFLESSLFLNSESVTSRCLHYLKYNTEVALRHNSFLDISSKTIETLLKLDTMNVSEIKLLLNIVRWAELKSNADRASSFRSIMTPLLRFIRFGALAPTQFISFLETKKLKELLLDQDALGILKHLIQPLSCPLPDWCCTKTWRGGFMSKEMGSFDKKVEEHVKTLSLGVSAWIENHMAIECRGPLSF